MHDKKTAKKQLGKKVRKSRAKSGSWLKAIVLAFLLIFIVRTFVFQLFVIQNSTMEGNLYPGDIVFINKLVYGPRLPMTPVSVPLAPLRDNFSAPKCYLNWVHLPYLRIPGFGKMHHNDIIAFNYPEESGVPVDKKIVYVKRCVALAGDTLLLRFNRLYINGIQTEIGDIQYKYRVFAKGKYLSKGLLEKYGINEGGLMNKYGEYELYLSNEKSADLQKNKDIRLVERDTTNLINEQIFKPTLYSEWTLDNFGPVVVPKAGKFINLTPGNIALYDSLIIQYENHKVETINGRIFIDGEPVQGYTFKNNYYFVLDDNRDNSKDSRHWGFLPEKFILGRVGTVFCSFNPEKGGLRRVRWSRIFKKLK